MAESRDSGQLHINRLAQETSPYLLQHKHNPVDWYPWGPEAFESARRQDKPIFLSVGYSTCYWCHVMERQCFENEQIADEMNRLFINVKVDREERPDVDQLYMTAVQVLTRHGGWPMSVWLTPDLRPFYAGTYFPPTDAHGRPGFLTICRGIEDAYRNRRDEVEKAADQLVNILRQLSQPPSPARPVRLDGALIDRLVDRSIADFDEKHGGFGSAPKFPRQTLLEMLLTYLDFREESVDPDGSLRGREARINHMITQTLDALAHGGIRDHLGGGFHRYSTDARWLIPHFEIMLYDNALLGWCYVDAYRRTEKPLYAQVARGIFDFVLREMTDPQTGAFFTAFDAEVDAREGQSYLWTAQQILEVLGEQDGGLFNRIYGVDRGPNFADPHHGSGEPDTNVLYLPEPIQTVAERENLDLHDLETRLVSLRQRLYQARRQRKQPMLDTKIITSWNALMIRGLALAGQALAEPAYLSAAERCASFLLNQHRRPDGTLVRSSRDGQVRHDGFLEDYAYLMQALLALHDAGRVVWKDHAANIAMVMLDKFADSDRGGFFFASRDATDLIVRQKTAVDSPLPSGNAVAGMCLQQLGLPERTGGMLETFIEQLEQNAEGMSALLTCAMRYIQQFGELDVAPRSQSPQRPTDLRALARDVVEVSTEWLDDRRLAVMLNIHEGFHLQANPASQGMVPTEIRIVSGGWAAAVDYPPAQEMHVDFAEDPINIYTGPIRLVLTLREPPGDGTPLELLLSYQPCDERACLPVTNRMIRVPAGSS